jgi:hypothetical protein
MFTMFTLVSMKLNCRVTPSKGVTNVAILRANPTVQ